MWFWVLFKVKSTSRSGDNYEYKNANLQLYKYCRWGQCIYVCGSGIVLHNHFGYSFFYAASLSCDAGFAGKRKRYNDHHLSALIEVDGGINSETICCCARCGADTFVSGTTIFHATSYKNAISKLRKNAEKGSFQRMLNL